MPGGRQPPLQGGVHGVGQRLGVGDQDAAGLGVVLGLGQEVGGHVLGVGGGVGQDHDLGGPGLRVNADHPPHRPLGGGHVDVARAGDHVHRLAQHLTPGVGTVHVVLDGGAVGQHGNGLRPADGVDLLHP